MMPGIMPNISKEMFEYRRDTALLHAAFISYQAALQREKGKKHTLNVLRKAECKDETFFMQRLVPGLADRENSSGKIANTRSHAVLLYQVLNEQFDFLEDEVPYFESVQEIFPSFGWTLYFESVKSCQWKNEFCECMQALPKSITVEVLKTLLSHARCDGPEYNDLYLFDSALLVLLKIYCNMTDENDSIHSNSEFSAMYRYFGTLKICCNKLENKAITTSVDSEKNNEYDTDALLDECYKEVLNFIHQCFHNPSCLLGIEGDTSWTFKVKQTVLGIVTLSLKHIIEVFKSRMSERYIESVDFETLERWFNRTREVLDPDSLRETAEILQQKQSGELFTKSLEVISSCKDFFDLCANIVSDKDCLSLLDPVDDETEKIIDDRSLSCIYSTTFLELEKIMKWFKSVCPLETSKPEVLTVISNILASMRSYFQLEEIIPSETVKLLNTVNKRLLGFREAMACILLDDNLNNITFSNCLDENIDLLCHQSYLEMFIDRLSSSEYSSNSYLSQIYMRAYMNATVTVKHNLLMYIAKLDSTCLKQDDFYLQLTTFLNKSVSEQDDDQIASQAYALCMQSLREVLCRLVSDALDKRGDIPSLAQVLTVLKRECCLHLIPGHPALFISSTRKVLKSSVMTPMKLQNMRILIKALFLRNSDFYLTLVEEIFHHLVLDFLHPKVQFGLQELALGLLEDMCELGALSPERNFTCASALCLCLCQLLHHAQVSMRGQHKMLILSVLTKYRNAVKYDIPENEAKWLRMKLDALDLSLKFYLQDFMHLPLNDIQDISRSILQLCKLSSILGCSQQIKEAWKDAVKKRYFMLDYPTIVVALAKIIAGCTHEEWHNLFSLLTFLVEDKLLLPPEALLFMVPQNSQSSIVPFKLLVDAQLVLYDNIQEVNWPYVLSCMSAVLNEGISSSMWQTNEQLIIIFCEICRLSTKLIPAHTAFFSSTLCEILNKLSLQKGEKTVLDLVYAAVEVLPEGETKMHVKSRLEE